MLRRGQDKALRRGPSLTASWLAAYRSVPTPVVANTGPSISVTAGPGERYCMVLHVGPSPALMTEMRACTHMSVSIAEPQTSPSPVAPNAWLFQDRFQQAVNNLSFLSRDQASKDWALPCAAWPSPTAK